MKTHTESGLRQRGTELTVGARLRGAHRLHHRLRQPDRFRSDTGWNSALGLTFVSQATTIGDAGMASVVDRGIIAFDRTSQSVAWSDHSSTLASVRAAAAQGGTLILLRQDPLLVEARRQNDGGVLWSYAPSFGPPTGFTIQEFLSDPILTDNLVFVSTHQGVFAIDRRSGTPRWFFGVPGSLAITPSGTLLISDPSRADLGGGSVTAVNLR
jgi:outer membrane protein assembly factor BamB